jgi:hypothetical protein
MGCDFVIWYRATFQGGKPVDVLCERGARANEYARMGFFIRFSKHFLNENFTKILFHK